MRFEINVNHCSRFQFGLFDTYGSFLYGIFDNWIILEYHSKGCSCSYCREKVSGAGFSRPENKSPSAWRLFHLKWRSGIFYLRFTLPEWLCKRTSAAEKFADRLAGREIRKWK